MELLTNVSLKQYNTFGIDVKAVFFATADIPGDIEAVLTRPDFKGLPLLLLGGGSNILFTKNFEGLVLKINFRGVRHQISGDHKIELTAGAGENWHELVAFCVNHGWGGLENLALIPGTVGAAPIQNIGAYGVELKDVFSHLEALDMQTFDFKRFTAQECNFAYRNSIFKNELKNRYLITSVTFLLSQKPDLNLSYPVLRQELEKSGRELNIKTVAEAVMRIRRSKLPDPEQLGNAGSFFKNPVVDGQLYEQLKEKYPEIHAFIQDNGKVKIPAAWLIDQCGWKGKRIGDAGVHALQPLVLVNYGNATGQDIIDLAERIKESVFDSFGVLLEPEVNIL